MAVKIFKIFVSFLFFIVPVLVLAKGGEGVPVYFVFFQILNFSLFSLALWYLIRKHLPAFLERKQRDFLEYRERAKKLGEQYQKDCVFMEKEVQSLVEKEKNINQSVVEAVNNLKKELETQEKQWLENLRIQTEQEVKRHKLKEVNCLKDRLLSQVMQKTEKRLKETKTEEFTKKLSHWTIQKWG